MTENLRESVRTNLAKIEAEIQEAQGHHTQVLSMVQRRIDEVGRSLRRMRVELADRFPRWTEEEVREYNDLLQEQSRLTAHFHARK